MAVLSWGDIETNAIAFSKRWKDCKGDEKQESQTFEKELMSVFGVDWREGLHEHRIVNEDGVQNYIDYILPGKILIEMKSKGESLIRGYNQAVTYSRCLKPDEYPELLMVCDFDQIQVTNLRTGQTFQKFKLNQFKKHLRMFGIVAGYTSEVTFKTDIEVNTDASYKMAKLHDGLKENGYQGKNLEVYLVRLLFCLFAEDTGIFEKAMFENYIKASKEDGSDLSARLMELFSILDTPSEKRMSSLRSELKRFRYINGKLFLDYLPAAAFDVKMRQTLVDCCDFDWSYISPAVFGAMFQGVMDEQQRRETGAHYTSEENIMKVIKPLFLDDLWIEFDRMKSTKAELEEFHNKIAALKFLDPACGCGNFLILTYRELRLLEFEVLKMLHDNTQLTMIDLLCKVSVSQFYGIEYEEFPCQIAQVGLLLMKHQMDKEVSNYFGLNLIDFPIKETATIVHGNALVIEWREVVPPEILNYILGNPPFIGSSMMSEQQKSEAVTIYGNIKLSNSLDYVGAWYYLAAKYIQDSLIRCAFVSTNSITQGEQVKPIWDKLLSTYHIKIDFACRTFKWGNDARGQAAVHCVIIGFSLKRVITTKRLTDKNGDTKVVSRINPYLVEAPDILVESRSKSICNAPLMTMGNKPTDGGHFILSKEEKDVICQADPRITKYIRKYLGSAEYINGLERYCIWLKDADLEWKKSPEIIRRVKAIRDLRLKSTAKPTREKADAAHLFFFSSQPTSDYIVVPSTSSQARQYVPIGILPSEIIVSNAVSIVHSSSLYVLGILTSSMHMAWMRTVSGRLKSDYRYTGSIVYNTFPFPDTSEEQKEKIARAAQNILDTRTQYPDNTLADLYNDPMPEALLRAHRALDRAVEKAYGKTFTTEEERVAFLFEKYSELIKEGK